MGLSNISGNIYGSGTQLARECCGVGGARYQAGLSLNAAGWPPEPGATNTVAFGRSLQSWQSPVHSTSPRAHSVSIAHCAVETDDHCQLTVICIAPYLQHVFSFLSSFLCRLCPLGPVPLATPSHHLATLTPRPLTQVCSPLHFRCTLHPSSISFVFSFDCIFSDLISDHPGSVQFVPCCPRSNCHADLGHTLHRCLGPLLQLASVSPPIYLILTCARCQDARSPLFFLSQCANMGTLSMRRAAAALMVEWLYFPNRRPFSTVGAQTHHSNVLARLIQL